MTAVGIAGMGSMLGTRCMLAQGDSTAAASPSGLAGKMPMRAFGKTGVKVSMLALGGIFDISANQLVLQRALDFGVTYWDTAEGYVNGNSEKGIGMYLEKHPEVRRQLFLVTKAGGPHTPAALTKKLEQSFERLKTDYVDLYFLHGIRGGDELTDEIKVWAEKAKAANKIKFFGFSTHGGMEETLQAAAKTGWVDGLMLKYDYRIMHTDAMRAAMDACEKAGIGVTAMKTQGGGPIHPDNDADLKLAGHFLQRGFTDKQAKVKAVWENPQVASVCSQMGSVFVLDSNAAAANDKTKLSSQDHDALRHYAQATCSQYCAGCTHLCEQALRQHIPVADVMRSLMYARVYSDNDLARQTFRAMSPAKQSALLSIDFSASEQICPQRLPIGKLMAEAHQMLA